jgi:hypothetical protein
MRLKLLVTYILLGVLFISGVTSAQTTTTVGNWQKHGDTDNNGYPDIGVVVSGHYTSVYAYDAYTKWYWDLGDGRIQGNVGSIADLDVATLTVCNYVVNYRGTFENDPFMNSGWIQNQINCSGYDDNGHYTYNIVHQTDPRYTGNPDWEIWGTWEYDVLVESGSGNLVRPITASGN